MAKKIEAIIREEKLGDVKDALRKIGIVGLNVTEVEGHGRQGGITLMARSGTYQVDMLPRIQLNIVLSDHNVEKTIQTIVDSARTGEDAGDGIIIVYPIEEVVRIRTGERGSEALKYEGDIDSSLSRYYAAPYSRETVPGQEKGAGSAGLRETGAARPKKGLLSRLLGPRSEK